MNNPDQEKPYIPSKGDPSNEPVPPKQTPVKKEEAVIHAPGRESGLTYYGQSSLDVGSLPWLQTYARDIRGYQDGDGVNGEPINPFAFLTNRERGEALAELSEGIELSIAEHLGKDL